jgi:hypothetical protein
VRKLPLSIGDFRKSPADNIELIVLELNTRARACVTYLHSSTRVAMRITRRRLSIILLRFALIAREIDRSSRRISDRIAGFSLNEFGRQSFRQSRQRLKPEGSGMAITRRGRLAKPWNKLTDVAEWLAVIYF